MDLSSAEQVAETGPDALREQLLPPDVALATWPKRQIDEDAAERFTGGQAVPVDQNPAETGWVTVYGRDGQQFLGVGELAGDGTIAPRRIFRVAPQAATHGQGKKP